MHPVGQPARQPAARPQPCRRDPRGSSPATGAVSPMATRSPAPASSPAPPTPTASSARSVLGPRHRRRRHRDHRSAQSPLPDDPARELAQHPLPQPQRQRRPPMRRPPLHRAHRRAHRLHPPGRAPMAPDGVPLWSADRAAINAGAHPLECGPTSTPISPTATSQAARRERPSSTPSAATALGCSKCTPSTRSPQRSPSHRATNATTWVECEVNLTSITPPRQIVLRIDQRALQRLAREPRRHAESRGAQDDRKRMRPRPAHHLPQPASR